MLTSFGQSSCADVSQLFELQPEKLGKTAERGVFACLKDDIMMT